MFIGAFAGAGAATAEELVITGCGAARFSLTACARLSLGSTCGAALLVDGAERLPVLLGFLATVFFSRERSAAR